MDKVFSMVGIAEEVKSDNSPPFSSKDVSDFVKYLVFHHRKITPYWPQANAEVEDSTEL